MVLTDHQFFSDSIVFSAFDQSHFYAVFTSVLLLVSVLVVAKRLDYRQNILVCRGLSLLLCATVMLWSLVHVKFGRFSAIESLPLSICNLFALIAPLLFWIPNQKRFEVIYYFVFSGTLQAIITPDPSSGYPSYSFFKYWIVHCGLIIIVIHYLVAFKLYPSVQGIWRAFLWLNLYLLCVFPINWLLDANYFYLMHKPEVPSLLDFFGPWPIYLIVSEILAMLFFALSYIPSLVARKLAGKQVIISGENETIELHCVQRRKN